VFGIGDHGLARVATPGPYGRFRADIVAPAISYRPQAETRLQRPCSACSGTLIFPARRAPQAPVIGYRLSSEHRNGLQRACKAIT